MLDNTSTNKVAENTCSHIELRCPFQIIIIIVVKIIIMIIIIIIITIIIIDSHKTNTEGNVKKKRGNEQNFVLLKTFWGSFLFYFMFLNIV